MLVALLSLALAARALPVCPTADRAEHDLRVYVLTMPPGGLPYTLVGHTAVWVSDTRGRRTTDVFYSFGTFDSDEGGTIHKMLMGRLPVWWSRATMRYMRNKYGRHDRPMLAQRLDLGEGQLAEMSRTLASWVEPQVRSDFHWLDNNCTSAVRDLVDEAVAGALREATDRVPVTTYRREVLRHLGFQPWAWFGWTHQANAFADRGISAWDSMFLPDNLRKGLGDLHRDGVPVVGLTCELQEGGRPWPPEAPPDWRLACWGLGLPAGAGVAVAARWRVAFGAILAVVGLLAGFLGTANAFFWAFSTLPGAGFNENLSVTSPLSLGLVGVGVAVLRRRVGRWSVRVTTALAALGAAGTAVALVPSWGQENLDVVGLFFPVLAAVAWGTRRIAARGA